MPVGGSGLPRALFLHVPHHTSTHMRVRVAGVDGIVSRCAVAQYETANGVKFSDRFLAGSHLQPVRFGVRGTALGVGGCVWVGVELLASVVALSWSAVCLRGVVGVVSTLWSMRLRFVRVFSSGN